jgi:hypothetical protein
LPRRTEPSVFRNPAFHVAWVEYRIRSIGHALRLALDPAYANFQGSARSIGSAHSIEIEARRGDPLPDPGWRLIFTAGDVWRLFASGDRRMIVRYAGEPPGPLCAAVFDREVRSVEVTCSRRMLRSSEEGEFLENPVQYPLDQLLLIQALGDRGVLAHAAGAEAGGRGILLSGASGAGKTTLSRLLETHGGFRLLSDDRVVVGRESAGFMFHGTPWPGEGRYALDEAIPLAAVAILRQGPECGLRRLSPSDGLRRLLPTMSVFWPDPDRAQLALGICQALSATVPVYEFTFSPDRHAPDTLERLLQA